MFNILEYYQELEEQVHYQCKVFQIKEFLCNTLMFCHLQIV